MEINRKVYRIPTNYKDSGYIFNGMIATRNAIDAVWMAIVGFILAKVLPFSEDNELTGMVFFVAGFAMIGVMGIREVPVSTYLFDLIMWTRRRKPYLYNNHGTAYSVTAADVMLNTPGFRDSLADTLDKVKTAMQTKKPDYIEGETFQFADDPEMEALAEAERQQMEESGELAEEQPAKTESKAERSKSQPLDFNDIAENIVLHDIEEDS